MGFLKILGWIKKESAFHQRKGRIARDPGMENSQTGCDLMPPRACIECFCLSMLMLSLLEVHFPERKAKRGLVYNYTFPRAPQPITLFYSSRSWLNTDSI